MRLMNSFLGPEKCGAGSFLPSSVSMVMVPAKARDLAAAGPSSHSLLFTICSTFTPGPEPRPPPPHPGGGFRRHRVARVDGSAGCSRLRPGSPSPSSLVRQVQESSLQHRPPPGGFSNSGKIVRPRDASRGCGGGRGSQTTRPAAPGSLAGCCPRPLAGLCHIMKF